MGVASDCNLSVYSNECVIIAGLVDGHKSRAIQSCVDGVAVPIDVARSLWARQAVSNSCGKSEFAISRGISTRTRNCSCKGRTSKHNSG